MEPTPSTSGQPLLAAMVVNRTPQGSLVVDPENQILQPEHVTAGVAVEFIDDYSARRRFFMDEDFFDGLLVDNSGSEVEDDDFEQDGLDEEFLMAEDSPDEEEEDFQWTDDFSGFRGVREVFEEDVGPKIEGTSPSGLFKQIWDSSLMDTIVEQTNLYAWQTIVQAQESERGISAQSRLNDWTETSPSEIYRLFGLIIMMAMCVRGRVDEYWTTGVLGMPDFRKIMSKNRFMLLMKFLHFVDNFDFPTTLNSADHKIHKIKPLLDYLNTKFKAIYSALRAICIDESLLLWKGHLSWVQCIPSKAARFGIKTYEVCEAATGYVLHITLYTGKTSNTNTPLHGFTKKTAKIVIQLMTPFLGKGHTLYMDNFYNNIKLTRWLKSQKTDVVGTMKRRRTGTPALIQNLVPKHMPRGTMVGLHCGDISVIAWKDVKLVTTVSTYHNADLVQARRAGQDIMKPAVIVDYNKNMGGVDLKDQKLSMYLLERKRGVKWYIKVFKRLLNISILNAYIIYYSNVGQGKRLTHREFRMQLAAELIGNAHAPNTPAPRSRYPENPRSRLDSSLEHFPEQVELPAERETAKQSRFKRARCVRCLQKGQRKESNVICSQCRVFLCLGQCWREYHTLEQ